MLNDLWPATTSAITIGSIYAPMAVAIALTFNVTGILNLAQGEFYILGAFVALAFIQKWDVPLGAAAVLGVALMTVVGGLLYLATMAPLRRATEENLILLTLGLAFAMSGAALLLFGAYPKNFPFFSGFKPVEVFGAPVLRQSFWVIGNALVVLLAVWLFSSRMMLGVAMRATSDNPVAARIIGLQPVKMALFAFAISALLGALAGVMAAPLTFVSYEAGLDIVVKAFIAAVVGGWGSYLGAVLGSYLLGFAQALSATYLPTLYGESFTLGILLLLLLIRPEGILRPHKGRTA